MGRALRRNGIGITNMKTRAESLNGLFTINSLPVLGCVLIARFPLDLKG
jgi:signal transduction histidine kinase